MKDQAKTKAQLFAELEAFRQNETALRRRLAETEAQATQRAAEMAIINSGRYLCRR